MTSHDQFTAYLSLLKIRQSAGRRNVIIIDRAKHDNRSYLASTSPPQVARSGYQGIHASGDHKISSN